MNEGKKKFQEKKQTNRY